MTGDDPWSTLTFHQQSTMWTFASDSFRLDTKKLETCFLESERVQEHFKSTRRDSKHMSRKISQRRKKTHGLDPLPLLPETDFATRQLPKPS